MKLSEIKKAEEILYKVNQVPRGFAYWRRHLLERCFGTFRYMGLPDSLPEIELEKRILFGFAGVFRHPAFGIVTSWGGLSGINPYNRPTTFVWSQPALGSGNLEIGKECAIIYNDTSDETSETQTPRGLTELIDRFARLLADVDASLDIQVANSRSTSWTVVKNQAVADSVKGANAKKRMGDFDVVIDQSLMDNIKSVPLLSPGSGQSATIQDLITLKEHLLRDFMSQIGIKSAERKAERMLTDEIAADDALLDANLADMLEARKRGVERVNQLFGTNITVELGRKRNDPDDIEPDPEESGSDDKDVPESGSNREGGDNNDS